MSNAVVLVVRGMGHVPSKKNSKLWTGQKLITKPEYQAWIQIAIYAFECQLRSGTVTDADATLTERQRRSSIASSLPADDCWDWIPELHVRAERCAKGQEGATVTVERIET
jgi:hypothetical protein